MHISRVNVIHIRFYIVSFIFLFFLTSAYADQLHLKNGRTIEGLIENESATAITLNLGFGKITITKDEIRTISYSSPQEQEELKREWTEKYFSREELVPPRYKNLAQQFNDLLKSQSLTRTKQRTRYSLAAQLQKIEAKSEKLNKHLYTLGKQLTRADPQTNPTQYNELVAENNKLTAEIQMIEIKKNNLINKLWALDKEIANYMNQFTLFKSNFYDEYDLVHKNHNATADLDEKNFLIALKNKMEELENDFKTFNIQYTLDNSSVIVPVLLNNSVHASFIVDTGATLVVISGEIAKKLKIDTSQIKNTIPVIVADGRKITAFPYILNNIKVGEAEVEVENVPIAILEEKNILPHDGLLGMSFLEHFRVTVDVKTNSLILEKFSAH